MGYDAIFNNNLELFARLQVVIVISKGTKLNRVDHQDGNTSQTQCKQVKVGCSIYGISITIQYWYSPFTEIHIVLGFVSFCWV